MITLHSDNGEIVVKPTIFPDKTSQVWKLPKEILASKEFTITWNFEEEREIVDIFSLKTLLGVIQPVHLYMPYLPYGRQDKSVSNDSTFNLVVFAQMINALKFKTVSTRDAHNIEAFVCLFDNADHYGAIYHQIKAITTFVPTFLVFPDKGAMKRYSQPLMSPIIPIVASRLMANPIYCEKIRDQATGQILGTKVSFPTGIQLKQGDRLLIVDDICDGGATFIGVAKALREVNPEVKIGLFVTHGIFSRGRQHLLDNGIDEIYTTDSLLSNKDGVVKP